ncbi:serine/threonine-protein kinase [Streptomyces sp. XM83C]|uniref:serine/threonine-protein kinase n=1 Tax=Streptomyces sp. XM83C TaxID=2929781 RepID=UPI001FF8A3CC|nr:serine/threonine-protein kinase [Streptomyces sp. XM83C]MCK1820544.1 serine/threonine-protein kinase [Streptomyces sp. XM83C]
MIRGKGPPAVLHKDDPRSVGGYRLLDRLGAGGMGVVYRARSRSGREVAVKVVHAQYAEDAVFRARFRQEIDAVRKVSGAFTAPVVDADPEAVRPWMATQFVPAQSLAERIRAEGPLRGADLRRLALGLVEALRDIHRAGVVHRDLKPANVLMAEDGPRVIDFGISRAAENQTLTETGLLIGTPPFMSPEQLVDSRSVGPASDVFSLGGLLAFAVTGRGPFDADSPFVAAYRVMNEEPALDAVPPPLREILGRCLAKEPKDRPELDELGREFARALPEPDPDDASTVTLRRPEFGQTRPVTLPPARRRRRLRPLLAVSAALVVLAAGAESWWALRGPDAPPVAGAEQGPSPSASSRWAPLPNGFRPWQSSVYAKAVRGPQALSDANGYPRCRPGGTALFCGGNGVLAVRIDAVTGTVEWRADIAPKGVSWDEYDTAVIDVYGDAVVVQELLGGGDGGEPSARLSVLDAASGRKLWSRAVPTDTGGDATVAGGAVLTPSPDGRSLVARSPRDGSARWTVELPAEHYCTFVDVDRRPFGSCAAVGGRSGAEGGTAVYLAVDPSDGSVRRFEGPLIDGDYIGVLDGRLLFQTVRDPDVSPGGTAGSSLVSLDPSTGARRTVRLARDYQGAVSLERGVLYIAGTGRVTAVSPADGKELWTAATTLEQPGPPVLDRWGRTLYTASLTGRVAAFDAVRGTRLWETAPRSAQPNLGDSATVHTVEGALVVLTPNGTLFGIDPGHPESTPAQG